MKNTNCLLLALLLFITAPNDSFGQLYPDAPVSLGLNAYFQNWVVEEGGQKNIASQLVIPIGVQIPVRRGVEVRFSTSLTNLSTENKTTGATSSVGGLTDLKIQSNIGLLQGRFALGIVANIPTGKADLNRQERDVLLAFIAPDLAVRNSNLGAGFNLGSNLTYIHPISRSLSAGLTVGYLNRGSFDTTLPGGSSLVGFSPGFDATASVGLNYREIDSSFKILASYTMSGSESVTASGSESEVFKLGPRLGLNASYSRSYGRGLFTIGVEDIIRLKNSSLTGGALSTQLLNSNGNYLIAFLDNQYQASKVLMIQLSAVGRFIGKNEFDRGNSSLLEAGLTVFILPNERVQFGLGGKYFTGGGTSFVSDVDRTISGFEGLATLNIAF